MQIANGRIVGAFNQQRFAGEWRCRYFGFSDADIAGYTIVVDPKSASHLLIGGPKYLEAGGLPLNDRIPGLVAAAHVDRKNSLTPAQATLIGGCTLESVGEVEVAIHKRISETKTVIGTGSKAGFIGFLRGHVGEARIAPGSIRGDGFYQRIEIRLSIGIVRNIDLREFVVPVIPGVGDVSDPDLLAGYAASLLNTIAIDVEIRVVSDTITVGISTLGRVEGEGIREIINAIVVIVEIGIVTNTIAIEIGGLTGVVGKGIECVLNAIQIIIDGNQGQPGGLIAWGVIILRMSHCCPQKEQARSDDRSG